MKPNVLYYALVWRDVIPVSASWPWRRRRPFPLLIPLYHVFMCLRVARWPSPAFSPSPGRDGFAVAGTYRQVQRVRATSLLRSLWAA